MNDNTVVNMHYSQDEIKEEVSKILTKTFLSKNIFFLPPSSILAIFFRYLPRTEIRFMDKSRQTCSQKQIETLGVDISNKLLPIYSNFTQQPLTREIITDIFAELAERKIQVIAPHCKTTSNTF